MIGIIKSDVRYEILSNFYECIISRNLCDFQDIEVLVLPFGGIDSYYNIKQTNMNLIDILNNNDVSIIFTGSANDKLVELCKFRKIKLIEFLKDQEFIINNARLTAIGLIEYLQKDGVALGEESIFIMGYGNISYILAKLFIVYDVNFKIYSEQEIEKKYILLEGYSLGKEEDICNSDIIINTIPSNYDKDYSVFKDKRVIDIASSPYGFNLDSIEKEAKSYEVLGAIPSKHHYKSAGILIFKTMEKYLKKYKN